MKPLCLVMLLALCGGCGSGGEQRAAEAVPVRAIAVQCKNMPVELRTVGTGEAALSVAVISQVTGVLQSVHFTEGEDVQPGSPLFVIEQAPFLARLHAQEANLAKVHAEAENARVQYRRYAGLVGKEFVTKEQFDQVEANAKALEAAVKAAEAGVESAKLDLGYTEIRAAIGGRTGSLNIKPGHVVKANEQGTPLVTIHQIKPMLVRFSVPEQYLPEIHATGRREPLTVRARTKGTTGAETTGTLSFIDNAVDRASGTVLLKASFNNADESLWPGQFVEVTLVLKEQRGALVVPSEAVQRGQEGEYVWIVRPDKSVENRKVVQGFTLGQETVLTSGAAEGELVVVDGQFKLAHNMKVDVK